MLLLVVVVLDCFTFVFVKRCCSWEKHVLLKNTLYNSKEQQQRYYYYHWTVHTHTCLHNKLTLHHIHRSLHHYSTTTTTIIIKAPKTSSSPSSSSSSSLFIRIVLCTSFIEKNAHPRKAESETQQTQYNHTWSIDSCFFDKYLKYYIDAFGSCICANS